MTGGMFLGIFLVLWGAQILLSNLFGISIPFIQYALAIFLIYCGLSMLFPGKLSLNPTYYGYSNQNRSFMIDQDSSESFKVRAGTFVFDNTPFEPTERKKVNIDGAFSNIAIILNPRIHTIVHIKSTFSSIQNREKQYSSSFKDKQIFHFGPTAEPVMLEYHIRMKLSSLHFT
jgi:hypothetical protein